MYVSTVHECNVISVFKRLFLFQCLIYVSPQLFNSQAGYVSHLRSQQLLNLFVCLLLYKSKKRSRGGHERAGITLEVLCSAGSPTCSLIKTCYLQNSLTYKIK